MTEAEIMKALECWSKPVGGDCDECSLKGGDCLKVNLEAEALDLINRKNTEIERLTINMNAFGLGLKREAERADSARAEAIKDFIATLKAKKGLESFCGYRIFDWEFDQIAKEMGVEL